MQDTIAAIATAPGTSALSIVRVSGESAIQISDRVFQGKKTLKDSGTHTVLHGFIVDLDGKPIDEVVVSVFLHPASFTGEDGVEITCHGGSVPAKAVLKVVLSAGARIAEPGEFTKRAFLNGKLDLSQAEAVCDLIESKTEASMRVALKQLEGGLSREIKNLKDDILSCLAELEARIDFPEDVESPLPVDALKKTLNGVVLKIDELLKQKSIGRAFREGLRIPIVGGPNVGKSSLFNAILGEERAIVTEVPGTTRDFIEASMELEGFPLTFVDTAGLRETKDPVETKGVEKTEGEIQRADIIIYIVDPTSTRQESNEYSQRCLAAKDCVLTLSKSDLKPVAGFENGLVWLEERFGRAYKTSSLTKEGLPGLMTAIGEKLKDGFGSAPEEILLTNMRHVQLLEKAREEILQARLGLNEKIWDELISFHLNEAKSFLDEITGEKAGGDLLDRIFSRFCVGK
ncbi:MAG: tRNA uridine-5-carboxymethylaminomethyl(34) synthesis GTPase MnmE [Candidatus Eisenbacteria bacterium]|nr:tRNA uridine-5-carboxymethylaminomethyl(34) synthesis GTPase MnmE [Candidatus Eisenbacteria bacterium]